MELPLSKSHLNTYDADHPVREDLILCQLFEEARISGWVGELVNLETGSRMKTTELLDKVDSIVIIAI